MFGGNPLMQYLGNSGFNSLLNSLSINNDRVKLSQEFEIIIEVLIDNNLQRIVLISSNNPKNFINQIKLK